MYGWRGRVGSISATPTEHFPYEFYRIVPEGVSIYQTCLSIQNVTEEELEEERTAKMEAIAKALVEQGVDCIIIGGAPSLFIKDPGFDREWSQYLSKVCGVEVLSNQTAMMDALRVMECENILVATPFTQPIYSKLETFLIGSDFKVAATYGMNFGTNLEIAKTEKSAIYQFVKASFKKTVEEGRQVDGILIPCANWPSTAVVEELEHDLGVPVVTSNLAKIWSALTFLNVHDEIRGHGRLLANYI